jgi:hypothetical protein
MGSTLTKIKNLERIYIGGYGDDFIDRALDKLLAQQRAEDEASLRVLRADLDELERRYSMTSDAFEQRYRQGSLGDAADFVEWNALYRMYTKVQNRLALLQG